MNVASLPLPKVKSAFAAINSIYAHAYDHVDKNVLNAWYNGAMVFETGMPDIARTSAPDNDPALRAAYFAGERGEIPLDIYGAADRSRRGVA